MTLEPDFERLNIRERKIIVGIDFGTTYSGVVWAETQRPERRNAITSWPVSRTIREGEFSDKVPTKLRYDGDKPQWGFSIPVNSPADETIEWFKLDLDASLESMGENLRNAAARGGRDVDTLITDYISALGEHLMYVLREKLSESILQTLPLEFVVTVPAIWSDLAKDKTRQACQRASGLPTTTSPIHLVSEPEAAAIYALHGLDPHGLKVGDSFVVCDAGGGTVDLISYTILKLKPILEIQEAAPGTGGLCGSTFLNMRFKKFLTSRLGKLAGFDDVLLAEAMETFEKSIKRKFTMAAARDEIFPVPVGGLQDNKEKGVSRGRYALKASDVWAIFEPVVEEVIKLVKEQIKSSKVPIRAVLMVGGFGASNYLKERLRNAIDKKILVLQPPNAWLAVAHGAVMKGLALSAPEQLTMVKVQTRKARKHYGTEWRVRYDDTRHGHLKSQRHWCGLDGCYKVRVMEWFIQRGDPVAENEPFITSFTWAGLVSQGQIKKIGMDIYCDRTERNAPMAKDEYVRLLCRVEADLSHIPENMLRRRKGYNGEWYYELCCKIEAVYQSASTQYTLIYNGQRYNSVTAEYV
ncbi:chaperone protein DnaK [Naviculisporaceae sp. PSN 640]